MREVFIGVVGITRTFLVAHRRGDSPDANFYNF